MDCSFVVESASFEASGRGTAQLKMPVGETARLKTCAAAACAGYRSCLGIRNTVSSFEGPFSGCEAFARLQLA